MSRTGKRNSNTLQSLISFFAKRIGLAYLGDLNWKGQAQYEVLSVTDYVSSTFPRTFLTDGRTFSFEDHARKLESALLSKGVAVQSVYYNADLKHEYQFELGTVHEDGNNYAQMPFDQLKLFLAN